MKEHRMNEAILILSFGGPDGPEDVMPFLENVLRGRPVPRERMLEVADHYHHFGGRSPINQQNRELIAALQDLLARQGPALPVYWGNRNWHPLVGDTFRKMADHGITRVYVFATSMFSSYSGCRQYLDNLEAARAGTNIEVLKLRLGFNHPGFIEPLVTNLRRELDTLPEARPVFTAHSVPLAMASNSLYVEQLTEASRLIAGLAGAPAFDLVYQSRSGAHGQPWLEPDICDHLRTLAAQGIRDVLVVPVGFISDHMEVLYDLDTEAAALAVELGLRMRRVSTVGAAPGFVSMIRELVLERRGEAEKRWLGKLGPAPDLCAAGCCPAPIRVRS
ncbi:MAG: ferrochelatase [Acidobacteria bacterium]|nr:ferrochelatase [Acidobacteriota bacterium]